MNFIFSSFKTNYCNRKNLECYILFFTNRRAKSMENNMKTIVLLLAKCLTLTLVLATHHDYCVIGAGPSGLQFSYFLQKARRDYVTFEKGGSPGTFFTKYPIHRYLLSINKRFTGKTNKEFNLRHDWNSLLSHDDGLKMTKYTEDLFPSADVYVKYLSDYARKLSLNIQYNTTISNIKERNSTDNLFHFNDQWVNDYSCKTVIMATGMSKPFHPKINGSEYLTYYEDLPISGDKFDGKSVLILGKGNSGFETAEHILKNTETVHIISRSRVKLAWETHYVGDIRSNNNGLLDTYMLKSLDAPYEGDIMKLHLKRSLVDGKLHPYFGNLTFGPLGDEIAIDIGDVDGFRKGYNHVISCLGFQFDNSSFGDNVTINPAGTGRLEKYPRITYQYQSTDIKGMYFVGASTHSLDFRKSAGGFVHGFRYTAQVLHRIMEKKLENIPWPSIKFDNIIDGIYHLIKRINEASDIYQMFTVLCDVMIFDQNSDSVTYLDGYPCALASRLQNITGHTIHGGVLFLSLEYGLNFSGPGSDPFRDERATREAQNAHNSNFLHPVLYFYEKIPSDNQIINRPFKWILPVPDSLHHMVEDLTTLFNAPDMHVTPLRRFFEKIFKKDFRQYFAGQCMVASLTYKTLPESCKLFDDKKRSISCGQECLKTMLKFYPSLSHKFSAII